MKRWLKLIGNYDWSYHYKLVEVIRDILVFCYISDKYKVIVNHYYHLTFPFSKLMAVLLIIAVSLLVSKNIISKILINIINDV